MCNVEGRRGVWHEKCLLPDPWPARFAARNKSITCTWSFCMHLKTIKPKAKGHLCWPCRFCTLLCFLSFSFLMIAFSIIIFSFYGTLTELNHWQRLLMTFISIPWSMQDRVDITLISKSAKCRWIIVTFDLIDQCIFIARADWHLSSHTTVGTQCPLWLKVFCLVRSC